ncbi:MAG: FAD-dependent oxidoreductase [Acidobacteriota bacterium]
MAHDPTAPITILGAGIAGLAAAHELRASGADAVIYEAKPYAGGHTATFETDGFYFDDGPHISFTKNERIQKIFADAVDGQYETIQTRVNNLWRGHWIKHPAQVNLHGLPSELLVTVLKDFIESRQHEPDPSSIRHYRDWLHAAFGRTFAETFPEVYGLKYHTTTADNMTTDWLGPRLYRPDLEEVLRGALSPDSPDVHYVTHFRYPSRGGFETYLKPFIAASDIQLEHEVTRIDPGARRIRFAHGGEVPYGALISSLPLPVLVRCLPSAPDAVREAAYQLACTTCVVINVGLDREDISAAHWTYYYDPDLFFTRASFPHMLAPNNVPAGCSSIQIECYFSDKYKPLLVAPEDCIEPVLRDLRRCGYLREGEEPRMVEARLVPYANVIFDLDRPQALATVHDYLRAIDVHPVGRYGLWGYHWTDEAFISGEEAARAVLDGRPPLEPAA